MKQSNKQIAEKIMEQELLLKNPLVNKAKIEQEMVELIIRANLSMEDMEKAINGNNYSDTGQEKGVSLIKRDNHFKNPIDELDKAA